jgi:hypothetical protein
MRAWTIVLFAAFCLAAADASGAVVIKMGTVAPEGSPWHETLRDIAASWQKLSNGQVTLRIYPGGVAGDESDMLRKMRIGQLNAAALTSGGLGDVRIALTFPLLCATTRSWRRCSRNGPRLPPWAFEQGKVSNSAGWVYFFSPSR